MSPLLHLNPKLQIFCTLSFLFSDSQESTFPLPLSPDLTTFGFQLHLCQQTTSPMTSLLTPVDIFWTWPLLTPLHYFTHLAVLPKSISYPKCWTLHSTGFFMVSILETFNSLSLSLRNFSYSHNFTFHINVQVTSKSLSPVVISYLHSSLWNLTAYQVFQLLGSFTGAWGLPSKEPTPPPPRFCSQSLVSSPLPVHSLTPL